MGRGRITDTDSGKVRATIAPLLVGHQKNWTEVAADAHDDAYWGTTAGNIYGYSATGSMLLSLAMGSSIKSYPALGGGGMLR
jgi:hypothetical protein